MKKVLKITGITLLVLLILIISLPFMFKGKIINIVNEQANANLNAKVDFGEFDLGLISTFPNFNFSIDNVTVDGVDKFEGTQLANINNLSLKVDLMSVISGDEIKIKSIYIEEPTVNAVVLADTSANWDIAKATEEIEEEVVEEEASPFKLNLQDLTIKNAKINYKDATMNLTTSIIGLNFNLSGDMTQDVTDLVTKTVIDELNLTMDNVAYFKKANVEADAIIKADLANYKFTFT
ncbi:MAG: AsmA family protein, partial [SAR202 cluster bacterium]|nr:AsmA family protein [SAR202 cluster bacterium]